MVERDHGLVDCVYEMETQAFPRQRLVLIEIVRHIFTAGSILAKS